MSSSSAEADPTRLGNVLGKAMYLVTEEYSFIKELGKGHQKWSGPNDKGASRTVVTVFLVKHKETGEEFACKSVSKRNVSPAMTQAIKREVESLRLVSGHPHVVNFKDAIEDKNYVHLLMEVCNGGELLSHIHSAHDLVDEHPADGAGKKVDGAGQNPDGAVNFLDVTSLATEVTNLGNVLWSQTQRIVKAPASLFFSPEKTQIYSERTASFIVRRILQAVSHCHLNGVIHADISPKNLLFGEGEKKSGNSFFPSSLSLSGSGGKTRQFLDSLKLVDFSQSRLVKGDSQKVKDDLSGSDSMYRAPETFPPASLERGYDSSIDVWSVGVLLFLLLAGRTPFEEKREADLCAELAAMASDSESDITKYIDFDSLTWISDEAKTLLRSMLRINSRDRITVEDALEHPWVLGHAAPSHSLGAHVLRKIKNFSEGNAMKKFALRVLSVHLDRSSIHDLRVMFEEADTDKSGFLSMKELKNCLEKFGQSIPEEEMQKLIAGMDADQSGSIDIDEFIAATISLNKEEREQALVKSFKFFDKDGSGTISAKELRKVLENFKGHLYTRQEIDEIIKEVDDDADGEIDYEEFVDLVSSKDCC